MSSDCIAEEYIWVRCSRIGACSLGVGWAGGKLELSSEGLDWVSSIVAIVIAIATIPPIAQGGIYYYDILYGRIHVCIDERDAVMIYAHAGDKSNKKRIPKPSLHIFSFNTVVK